MQQFLSLHMQFGLVSDQDKLNTIFWCSDCFLEELVLNPPREALQALFTNETNYLYKVVSGKTHCLEVITTKWKITLKKIEYSKKSSIMIFNFKKERK